jgi:hypothetical protein
MSIGSTGVIAWNTPILGTYVVTVTARDSVTGLTGKGVDTFAITPAGPAIAATNIKGVAGQSLAGSITFSDSSTSSLSIMISGVPAGMSFTVSGSGLNGDVLAMKWAAPVTGTYALLVTVTDAQKLSATATIPVTITAH